jgi:serine protease Do
MLQVMRRALRIAARLLLLGAVELVLLGAALPFVSADGEPEARRSQVVRAVERVKPAVVSVRTTQVVTQRLIDWDLVIREEPMEVEGSLGSGVVFHPAGFVITNAHVILRGSNFFVHPPGQEQAQGWRALPLAVDLTNDLAILRILPQEGRPVTFPYLPLGRSNDLLLGETAIAVGNPFKLGLSVSTGVVAGVNRSLKVGRTTFNDFIQVDAAINPGNSGGPLLDITGRWIGVTTSIYRRVYGAEGIAFAIPTDRVRRLVGAALKSRVAVGAWLGLDEVEGPDGAPTVKAVFPRGPAAASVLREGDTILSVNGQPTPTPYDYVLALLDAPLGSALTLRVRRGSSELPPVSLPYEAIPTGPLARERLGLEVSDVGDYEAGVMVRAAQGPAAKVGIQAGDVIVGLGSWRIRHTDDLLLFLQYVKTGDLVEVYVRRPAPDGGRQPARELSGRLTAN